MALIKLHESIGFIALYDFDSNKSCLWSIAATGCTGDGYWKDDSNICYQCHSSCKTCDGSTISDCLSCIDPTNEVLAYKHDGNSGNDPNKGECVGMLWSKKLTLIWYTSVLLSSNSLVGFYFSLHQGWCSINMNCSARVRQLSLRFSSINTCVMVRWLTLIYRI